MLVSECYPSSREQFQYCHYIGQQMLFNQTVNLDYINDTIHHHYVHLHDSVPLWITLRFRFCCSLWATFLYILGGLDFLLLLRSFGEITFEQFLHNYVIISSIKC